jgi:hypothetical protein
LVPGFGTELSQWKGLRSKLFKTKKKFIQKTHLPATGWRALIPSLRGPSHVVETDKANGNIEPANWRFSVILPPAANLKPACLK